PLASRGTLFRAGPPVLDNPAELLGRLGAPVELAQRRAEGEAQTNIVWCSLQRFPVLRDSTGVVPTAREQVALLAGSADNARCWRRRRGSATASRRQRQSEQDKSQLSDHLLIGPAAGRDQPAAEKVLHQVQRLLAVEQVGVTSNVTLQVRRSIVVQLVDDRRPVHR